MRKIKLILLLLLVSTISVYNAHAQRIQLRNLDKFENLSSKLTDIFIKDNYLNKKKYLKIFIRGKDLVVANKYPSNIKLEVYVYRNGDKKILHVFNRTLKTKKAAQNLIFGTRLRLIEDNETLYIDLYDSNNRFYGSYTYNIDLVDENFLNEVSSISDLDELEDELDCDNPINDPECLLEFFIQNVNYTTEIKNNLTTEIKRDAKGSYNVVIPVRKNRYVLKKKNIKKFKIKGEKQDNEFELEDGFYPFFDENDTASGAMRYDPEIGIVFGVDKYPNAFSILNQGGIALAKTELQDPAYDGAFEYDVVSSDLFFTRGNQRINLTGSIQNIVDGKLNSLEIADGGTMSGIYYFTNTTNIEDLNINGNTLFNDNSQVQIDGSLIITDGANQGYVLTSDVNGVASWQALPTDTLGTHIAGQNLNLNGFSMINANGINGTAAIFDNIDTNNIIVNNKALIPINSQLQINGEIIIDGGYEDWVLMSDANGKVQWINFEARLVNGDDMGSHKATIHLDMDNFNIENIGGINFPVGHQENFVLKSDASGNASWENLDILSAEIKSLNNVELIESYTNGKFLITNNSNLKVNGTLMIPNGAGNQYVLISDNDGVAQWADLTTLPTNGDEMGQHIATQNLDLANFDIKNTNELEANNIVSSTATIDDIYNTNIDTLNVSSNTVTSTTANILNLNATTVSSINSSSTDATITNLNVSNITGGTYTGNIQDPTINGLTVFSDNSSTKFNGTLTISSGANSNYVLASDVNGNATWQDLTTLPSNGDNLGNHLATTDLDMASNSINNIITTNTNDLQANTATVTTQIDSALFNGGTFNGDEANITTVNSTNANTTNATITNLNVSNLTGGTYTGNLQDPTVNGTTVFTDSSSTKFNGTINIPSGANLNYVLTSDVNGNASWQNLTTLPSNGDNLGNHIATQNLDMALYNIDDINITKTNDLQATTATITTQINSALFNGGNFNGNTATLTNLETINGVIANAIVTDANITNLNSTNITGGTYTGNLQDPSVNGTVLFKDNSNTKFNGSITIPAGANLNYVLASDINGNASWQDLNTLPSNGDNLGNHIATENLDMALFNIDNVNIANANDIQAVSATITTEVNSNLFNGGTFNGITANINTINSVNGTITNVNVSNLTATNINSSSITGTLENINANGTLLLKDSSILN